jgi:23S rRNA G2069 N7-methylase RlmK/C1962 C5-methylase RlmI
MLPTQEDAVRFMKAAVRDTWRRYNLIVLDPPPRFGRNRKQSEW